MEQRVRTESSVLAQGICWTPYILFFSILALLLLLYVYSVHLDSSPETFRTGSDLTIESGMTIREIADHLEVQGYVRSSLYTYFLLVRGDETTQVQAGVYRFDAPTSTRGVVNALIHGTSISPLLSVTFPEGFSTKQLNAFLPEAMRAPDVRSYSMYEGYLFPDTYFIAPHMTTDDVVELMRTTFTEKIAPYTDAIAASSFTLEEIIILASIVEREAKDLDSKQIVSGILQNRLERDMPLQVDAVFDYLLDKTSDELTVDDLALDSPYNTYTNRGLPPTPIANPGIESIEAVLSPQKTPYLYYLTGNDGVFYYARTFEEHKRNKARYLH